MALRGHNQAICNTLPRFRDIGHVAHNNFHIGGYAELVTGSPKKRAALRQRIASRSAVGQPQLVQHRDRAVQRHPDRRQVVAEQHVLHPNVSIASRRAGADQVFVSQQRRPR